MSSPRPLKEKELHAGHSADEAASSRSLPPRLLSSTTTIATMVQMNDKPNLQGAMSYRIAESDQDFDLLHAMRIECGWGAERLPAYRVDPNRVLAVLTMKSDNGEVVDVGMGGWVLDMPDDQETASRVDKIVYLTSLFIWKKYQGSGLGTKSIDLLERVAVEVFHARIVTLDTIAYHLSHGDRFEDLTEHVGQISRNRLWYGSKGYNLYRPIQPMFPHVDPKQTTLLSGVVMKKVVG